MSSIGSHENILLFVKNLVEKIYGEAGSSLPPSHDFLHVTRVVKLTRLICRKEGVEGKEQFLAVIAAYLHDIGMAIGKVKENHAAVSARYARNLLRNIIEPEDLAIIVKAVEEHSWSEGRSPSTKVSAILQDADRLDALGAIGIARVFAYSGYTGRLLYERYDPFAENRDFRGDLYAVDHFYEKLLKIPDKLNTSTARQLASSRIRVMKAFLNRLRSEILGEEC